MTFYEITIRAEIPDTESIDHIRSEIISIPSLSVESVDISRTLRYAPAFGARYTWGASPYASTER
jgi:hypothetical protein